RLGNTVSHCRGVVYAASIMGVTGTRGQVSTSAPALGARLRQVPDLPLGGGLGGRDGTPAGSVAGSADGGGGGGGPSRGPLEAPDEATGLAALRQLSAELSAGVRAPHRG